jgi:hypothetical protein
MSEHAAQTTTRRANRAPKAARPGQKLVTFAQAENKYGPPKNSWRDLALQGELPFIRLGTRYWLDCDDIEALLKRKRFLA